MVQCRCSEQLADLLTKALSLEELNLYMNGIGLKPCVSLKTVVVRVVICVFMAASYVVVLICFSYALAIYLRGSADAAYVDSEDGALEGSEGGGSVIGGNGRLWHSVWRQLCG